MKVKAKYTIESLYKEGMREDFIKDNTYEAREDSDFGCGYVVINEANEESLFIDERFKKCFKVVEE